MKTMKVCFVGIGSIAKRHIKNLRSVCDERGVSVQIDAFRSSNVDKVEGVDNVYFSLDEVPNDYDIVFITNPTNAHLKTLIDFHNKGNNFFIEKPVVDFNQLKEAETLELRDDAVYYVAAPLRYNAVIQWIKNNVDVDNVLSIRCISSSYLPDWRPGIDYRDTYSAHKKMGGGVSIDLIHEWDYITYLFGWPEKIFSLIGKKSELEIDSDDCAIYIADYKDKTVELHLDYFGRQPIREIMIITTDGTIIGDIVHNRIRLLRSNEVIDFNEERDDYQRKELSYFLDMINGCILTEDSYHKGIKVLNLTQGVC